jgi:hypothetical protein
MHVQHPLFLSDFIKTWIFIDRFSKNTQILIFLKIRLVGTELFHTDGRTHGEADSRFSQFHEFAW